MKELQELTREIRDKLPRLKEVKNKVTLEAVIL